MPYCEKCGNEHKGGNRFCDRCGDVLRVPVSKTNQILIWVIVVVTGIAALAIIIAVAIRQIEAKKAEAFRVQQHQIMEKTAFLSVPVADGSSLLLNGEGKVIVRHPTATVGLTLLKGVDPGKLDSEKAKILAAVKLVDNIRYSNLDNYFSAKEIDFPSADTMVLETEERLRITFAPGQVREGCEKLAKLLGRKDVQIKRIKHIDLRFKDPIVGLIK
jgi:hypothetical protein